MKDKKKSKKTKDEKKAKDKDAKAKDTDTKQHHKEAQAFYDKLKKRYVPRGLQRIPGRVVPAYMQALDKAARAGKDLQKASDAFWSDRGYTLVKKQKDAAVNGGDMKKTKKDDAKAKDKKKVESATKQKGSTKQKNKKKDKAAGKKSNKSSDDDGSASGVVHQIQDPEASFALTRGDSAVAKSILRNARDAGLRRIVDGGKTLKVAYTSDTEPKVLYKRARVVLRLLHSEERLRQIDALDETKLGASCLGYLYDMTDKNCAVCTDRRTCATKYMSHLVKGFPQAVQKATNASVQYVVTYTTDVNPYNKKKDKKLWRICKLVLSKKPNTYQKLRQLVSKQESFDTESAFADFVSSKLKFIKLAESTGATS